MKLSVRDAGGRECHLGQEGDLVTRGAFLMAGYVQGRQSTQQNFTPDDRFITGDRGVMDADGYVRISGRTKDIIMRAGENVPVKEIEDVLLQHPKVRSTALLGLPDPHLGEIGCACVIVEPGETFTMEEMRDFLAEQQVTRQF